MLARGERPGFDEIAAEAGVSRATAYRYFPGLDALLAEAAVDLLMPEPSELFGHHTAGDAGERLRQADCAIDQAIRQQEISLRLMLARILERSTHADRGETPLRQNRRGPLIERALEPLGDRLDPATRTRLVSALAIVIGSEAFIALNDVVGLDQTEAADVRHWAIDALLQAALTQS
jgi:AcrR family transcriptional regulator